MSHSYSSFFIHFPVFPTLPWGAHFSWYDYVTSYYTAREHDHGAQI